MLQRWTKTVALLAITAALFSACRKSEFSPDDPLPETHNPLVFTTSENNFLYALDPKTGVKKWELKLSTGPGLVASPVVVGDFVYLAMDSLYKVNAKKGTMEKVYSIANTDFKSFFSTPLVDGNTLYLGSRNDTLYAFDVTDGTIKWKRGLIGKLEASPVMYQDFLFVATTQGQVYKLDKNTGTEIWRRSVGGDGYLASPTIGTTAGGANAQLYLGCMDGTLYVVDATTGDTKWEYETKGPIASSPIAYGGNIVFGSYDYHVYCIDTLGKKPRWKFRTSDRVLSSPFGDNNVIYIGGYDYNMYALNIIDGTERWKYKTNALIKASPLVHEGTVYFGSFDKNLYAVDTSGKLKWTHNTNGIIESSPMVWDLTKGYYPSTSGNSIY